jgi:hypothetical protein
MRSGKRELHAAFDRALRRREVKPERLRTNRLRAKGAAQSLTEVPSLCSPRSSRCTGVTTYLRIF